MLFQLIWTLFVSYNVSANPVFQVPDYHQVPDLYNHYVTFVEEETSLSYSEVDEEVKKLIRKQKIIGFALGLFSAEKTLHLKGYGWEKLQVVPVSAKATRFRWASISKTLAAVAAMHLSRTGLVDLDKPISHYYPEYQTPFLVMENKSDVNYVLERKEVTLRMLMGHMAGIQHYENGFFHNPEPADEVKHDPLINTGVEWAMEYFISHPLISLPGSEYHYTTFGYNLLGVVLEKVTGRSFEEIIEVLFAGPLRLNTLKADGYWAEIPRRAIGYVWQRNGLHAREHNDISWKLPGGGYISTVEDMGKWCQSLMKNKVLSDAEKEIMWTNTVNANGEKNDNGLGFFMGMLDEDDLSTQMIYHSGAQRKVRSRLVYFPKKELCLVMATNTENSNLSEFVAPVLKAFEYNK